ncbi:hypothetical protein PG984_005336 [Apiospora sp. TS-2023a]
MRLATLAALVSGGAASVIPATAVSSLRRRIVDIIDDLPALPSLISPTLPDLPSLLSIPSPSTCASYTTVTETPALLTLTETKYVVVTAETVTSVQTSLTETELDVTSTATVTKFETSYVTEFATVATETATQEAKGPDQERKRKVLQKKKKRDSCKRRSSSGLASASHTSYSVNAISTASASASVSQTSSSMDSVSASSASAASSQAGTSMNTISAASSSTDFPSSAASSTDLCIATVTAPALKTITTVTITAGATATNVVTFTSVIVDTVTKIVSATDLETSAVRTTLAVTATTVLTAAAPPYATPTILIRATSGNVKGQYLQAHSDAKRDDTRTLVFTSNERNAAVFLYREDQSLVLANIPDKYLAYSQNDQASQGYVSSAPDYSHASCLLGRLAVGGNTGSFTCPNGESGLAAFAQYLAGFVFKNPSAAGSDQYLTVDLEYVLQGSSAPTAPSDTPTSGTPTSDTPTSGTATSDTPTSDPPTSDPSTSDPPNSGTPTSDTPAAAPTFVLKVASGSSSGSYLTVDGELHGGTSYSVKFSPGAESATPFTVDNLGGVVTTDNPKQLLAYDSSGTSISPARIVTTEDTLTNSNDISFSPASCQLTGPLTPGSEGSFTCPNLGGAGEQKLSTFNAHETADGTELEFSRPGAADDPTITLHYIIQGGVASTTPGGTAPGDTTVPGDNTAPDGVTPQDGDTNPGGVTPPGGETNPSNPSNTDTAPPAAPTFYLINRDASEGLANYLKIEEAVSAGTSNPLYVFSDRADASPFSIDADGLVVSALHPEHVLVYFGSDSPSQAFMDDGKSVRAAVCQLNGPTTAGSRGNFDCPNGMSGLSLFAQKNSFSASNLFFISSGTAGYSLLELDYVEYGIPPHSIATTPTTPADNPPVDNTPGNTTPPGDTTTPTTPTVETPDPPAATPSFVLKARNGSPHGLYVKTTGEVEAGSRNVLYFTRYIDLAAAFIRRDDGSVVLATQPDHVLAYEPAQGSLSFASVTGQTDGLRSASCQLEGTFGAGGSGYFTCSNGDSGLSLFSSVNDQETRLSFISPSDDSQEHLELDYVVLEDTTTTRPTVDTTPPTVDPTPPTVDPTPPTVDPTPPTADPSASGENSASGDGTVPSGVAPSDPDMILAPPATPTFYLKADSASGSVANNYLGIPGGMGPGSTNGLSFVSGQANAALFTFRNDGALISVTNPDHHLIYVHDDDPSPALMDDRSLFTEAQCQLVGTAITAGSIGSFKCPNGQSGLSAFSFDRFFDTTLTFIKPDNSDVRFPHVSLQYVIPGVPTPVVESPPVVVVTPPAPHQTPAVVIRASGGTQDGKYLVVLDGEKYIRFVSGRATATYFVVHDDGSVVPASVSADPASYAIYFRSGIQADYPAIMSPAEAATQNRVRATCHLDYDGQASIGTKGLFSCPNGGDAAHLLGAYSDYLLVQTENSSYDRVNLEFEFVDTSPPPATPVVDSTPPPPARTPAVVLKVVGGTSDGRFLKVQNPSLNLRQVEFTTSEELATSFIVRPEDGSLVPASLADDPLNYAAFYDGRSSSYGEVTISTPAVAASYSNPRAVCQLTGSSTDIGSTGSFSCPNGGSPIHNTLNVAGSFSLGIDFLPSYPFEKVALQFKYVS